jgi:hypothetical protein
MAGTVGLAGIVLNAAFVISYIHGFIAAVPFGVGGAIGCLTAFFIGYTADRQIIVQSRASTEHPLTWSAKRRPDTGRIRIIQTFTAVVALALVVWNAVNGSLGYSLLWILIGGLQFSTDIARKIHRRQYEIIDAGLVTTLGHLLWEDIDGYDLTDTELIIYGTVWPFGRIAYDRHSVDDLDAVVAALDRYLPQLDGEHDKPSIIDNLRQEVLS